MTTIKLFFFIFILSFSSAFVFAEERTISVDYGKLYEIAYNTKDVTVFEAIPDFDQKEIIFKIDVTSPAATLELTIPRELLDSKENGNDLNFFIVADGADVTFSEKKTTDTTRTLFMQLSSGSTVLEVFGTQLGSSTSENRPTVEKPKEEPTKEIPQEKASEEPQTVEQVPEKSVTQEKLSEKITSIEEKPTMVSNEKPSQDTVQNIFDFSKILNWYIPINERQMQQFVMATGAFVALIMVLIILKGLRTEKSLP